MLARTIPSHGVSQQQSCSGAMLRAGPYQAQHGRMLVVARTSYSTRSSSPRSESWRSSWRTELDHGSNGNGNGAHSHNDSEYHTAYNSNGNRYYSASSADQEEEQQYEHGWHDSSPSQAYSWAGEQDADDAAAADSANDGGEAEEDAGPGFFTDAFKDALKAALARSPLYADQYGPVGSGDEEIMEPEPYENEVETMNRPIFTDQFRMALKESMERQQTQLDVAGGYGSDDEYPATPYVPLPPPRREMSPLEEILATALGASQLHLRRLTLMKNEIEAAIERETKQVERLEFALTKAESDIAYYKTLERMMQEQRGK